MSNNTNNTTSITGDEFLPASQCIPWIVVLIIECLAIVVLNIITIIVFVKQRQLQRRGLYLITHLAIVDLLVGAVSGPLQIERMGGDFCGLWQYNTSITWSDHVKFALLHLFSMVSLANLAAISLERMYATFCPYKNFLMTKRFYYITIPVIWLTALIRECVQIALYKTRNNDADLEKLVNSTLYVPYYSISLSVIFLAYLSIFIKIRYTRLHSLLLPNSVTVGERKLTSTLLFVTIASLVSLLPVIGFVSVQVIHFDSLSNLSVRSRFHIRMTVIMFFLANSLANPIIYSMRMQPFRAGLAAIFHRAPRQERVANLVPLQNL